MLTLYSIIDLIPTNQFKKFLAIQISPTIATTLIAALLVIATTSVYAEEPEMTYAEKKAKNDPEYAKLLQHNKELYEKEHPGWQNEPKNELDALYSDKPYKKVIKPHEFGKATIPFLGAWEKSTLEDGLSYCIDDSVSFTLKHNFYRAMGIWSAKIGKISDDTFEFKRMKTCNNVDIEVKYEDRDSDDELDAETITTFDDYDNIIHSEVILYANTYQQKEGYQYNIEYDNDGGIDEDGDKGKVDGKFYRWYYNVMKHEIGHMLGLDHTSNANYLMNPYSDYDKNFPLSGCEAAAAIKKNFVDRDLDKIVCE